MNVFLHSSLRRIAYLVPVASLLVLAAGCDESAPLTPTTFSDALADAGCERAERCVYRAEFSYRYWSDGTDDDERARCVAMMQSSYSPIPPGFASGRVAFDASAAARYLNLFSETCGDTGELRLAERAVWIGQQRVGEPCGESIECTAGSVCSAEHFACGQCVALGTADFGEPCTALSDCRGADTGSVRCEPPLGRQDAVCMRVDERSAVLGEPCGVLESSTSNRTVSYCVPETYCRMETGEVRGTCQRPLEAGAPCVEGVDLCTFGNGCWAANDEVRCRPITLVTTDGGACGPDDGVCAAGLQLQCIEGECVRVGDGREGTPCLFSGLPQCADGFVCHMGRLECTARLPDGAACSITTFNHCTSGRCGGPDLNAPVCMPADACE